MIDHRSQFEQKCNINFMEAFLLAENHNIYFYLDNREETLLEVPIHFVYAKEASIIIACRSLQAMLNDVNPKSEVCEVIGYEAYISQLKQQMVGQHSVEVNLPLLIGERAVFIKLYMRLILEKQIYIGRIKVKDEEQSEKLYETSYKDALTGLFNRNTLMIHLQNLSRTHGVYGVMIDIDRFKRINDTYGHDVGDEVLRQFGQRLLDLADERAIFYRISGDEFFIQIKGDDNAMVKTYLHKVQEGIQSIVLDGEPITVSMGIAKYEPHYYAEGKDILRFTDLAMYIAKSKGRNTYHFLPIQEISKLAV